MAINKAKYDELERVFKTQVERDRAHVVDRVVQGWGVYLPSVEPEFQVDYIIVGMEPSFGWADSIEDAEKQIAEGFRNFDLSGERLSSKENDSVWLFLRSIDRFLCQSEETCHLTDVSKGAMPVTVAALDRERRWEEWYPLLLDEIGIVGKPGAPVIAIGKQVEAFLQKRDLEGRTGRRLYAVQHYSYQAARYFKLEAERDPEGFRIFQEEEFSEGNRWEPELSLAKRQLIFTYKKQFEAIRAER